MADVLDFNDAPTGEEKPISVALAYAARGWPVFPCNPLTKAPLTAAGFKDASTDAFQIRKWWALTPNAMVGVPTGRASGFWVLDIDQGEGKTGLQSLADMGHDLSELMDTVAANTASGGYHCLFRFDPDAPIGNSRGVLKRYLDVRGEGGYIIAAGSVRGDGRRYAWLNPPGENEIADAPAWLLDAVRGGAQADGFDFNSAQRAPVAPAERVASIQPGTWHENTRDLVARMVREGASDETIAAIAPRFTEAGYSHSQTVAEFLTHARTARQRWGYQPKDLEQERPQQAGDRTLIPILSRTELRELKRPQWLIDEVVTEGSVISIYGPSGSLKSFVALDMSMSVATGTPWHGREVKAGPAVYVTGEGRDQINARLQAWERAHAYTADAPIFVVPFGVPVSEPEWVRQLGDAIEGACGDASMIWLDTLARTFGQGDENSQKDMNAFIGGVDRLRDRFRTVVGVVHHTGKDGDRGLRGSSALYAAMDTVIRTDRKAGQMVVTLKNSQPHGKQKDASEFEDIALQASKVVLGTDEKGREITSLALTVTDAPAEEGREADDHRSSEPRGANQKAVVAALKKAKGEPLGLMRLMAVMRANNSSPVLQALGPLVAKGVVRELGEEGAKRWELV